MAVTNRKLYESTVAEIMSTPKPSHFRWEMEFILPNEIVKPRKLVLYEQICDYGETDNGQAGYCDKIGVDVVMTQVIYENKIYPNRNNLKVTLTAIPITESSDRADPNRKALAFTYQALLRNIKEHQLTNLPAFDGQHAITRVRLQLVDLGINELRLTLTGGVFVNSRGIDVIRTLLGYYSDKLKLPEQHRIIGVEHREPNVQEAFKNVIIPHGVPLLDVPGYVQKHCGGVYNFGLGFYLRRRVWYVYPLYDCDQYEKSRYRLDVIVTPPNRYPSADRSWMIKGQTLYVMTTGERDMIDKVDQLMANLGNGVQFAKATNVFDGWAKVGGNKATVQPDKNMAQYVAANRESKSNAVPFSRNRVTDNVAHETSEITKREGQYFQFAWDNSSPQLLYPGMPVKVLYESAQKVEELYGVLLRSETVSEPETSSESESRYRTSTVLTVFIKSRANAPL